MGFIEFYNSYLNNTAVKHNLGKKSHSDRFTDLCFETDLGIRYTNTDEYLIDEQQLRRIEIVRNTSGHPSYILEEMDGYIITIFDLSSGRKAFTPKPMRIVDETENYISFRGYPTIAKSLFGWEPIDMSDYGVTIYLEDGYVKGCIMHRFDTDVNYVYGLSSSMNSVYIEGPIIQAQITAESIIQNGFNFSPKSFIFYYCGQVTAYGITEVKVIAKVAADDKRTVNVVIIGDELADKIASSIYCGSIIQSGPSTIHMLVPKLSAPNDEEVNIQPSSCIITTSGTEIEKITFHIESPSRKLELIK